MFEYVTDHQAGLPLASRDNQSSKQPNKDENCYSPFPEQHDYTIAKQINWHGITKGAIDDYFYNLDMSVY